MRALVVDDSRTIRAIVKKALQAQGFETCLEAGDGKEALQRLKEAGPMDLALVDWNMPVMDGFELLTAIRASKEFDGMRMIMVTTESEASHVERALGAGANAYIFKPFSAEVLREKLRAVGLAKG